MNNCFVPAAPCQATEQDAVKKVVSGVQPVAWSPRGDTPLNEFPWLLSEAFDDVQ